MGRRRAAGPGAAALRRPGATSLGSARPSTARGAWSRRRWSSWSAARTRCARSARPCRTICVGA
eukprot:14050460-Alexandrium_andersonii.AAC.1